jgi:hypothetical protein
MVGILAAPIYEVGAAATAGFVARNPGFAVAAYEVLAGATDNPSVLRGAGQVASLADDAARAATPVASSAVQAGKLRLQLAAEQIAGGHSWLKHVIEKGEFPGVRTRGQFAEMIREVMEKATHVRQLSNGRTAYWSKGVVVIHNPRAADGGTAFVPSGNGFNYFMGLH